MNTSHSRSLFVPLATVALVAFSGSYNLDAAPAKEPMIQVDTFGAMPDGTPVKIYTLANRHGMKVKITEYGGIITELWTPDRSGQMANVVLGFDKLDEYTKGHPFFGAIAGRVANRIGKGKFSVDGKEYTLAVNNGPNHLHGGKVGFDKKVWKSRQLPPAPGAVAI